MKALFLISVLVLSNSLDFTAFPAADLTTLLQGFVVGLGAGDTDCSAAMTQVAHTIEITLQDVENYSTGSYLPILVDLNSLRTQFTALNDICDIAGLENQISRLLGPSGKAILMKNYIMHSKAINKDMDVLRNCTTNFFACGQSAGDIFKIMVGWSLSSPVSLAGKAVGMERRDISEMIGSLLAHIEWYAPEDCSEMVENIPSGEQIVDDVFDILRQGDREDLREFINIVVGVLGEDEVVRHCGLAYAGMAFYTIPTLVTDPWVWRVAYLQEGKEIVELMAAVADECTSDYYGCGANIANIINILVSYGEL